MTAETIIAFETIMHRNNTTLPAQNVRPTAADEKACETAVNVRGKTTAAVRGKNAVAAAALFSVVVLCFCLLSAAGAASIRNGRAIASAVTESTTSPMKTCHQNTPCGWAIYIPFTRRIDYFMRNTCDCSFGLACLKTDDDLSVNAYVYRCKMRPPSTVATTDVVPTTVPDLRAQDTATTSPQAQRTD